MFTLEYSDFSDGLLHPANFEKPLQSSAQVLHPLPKKQSTASQSQVRTASSASDPTASSTEKSSIQFSSTVGSKNSQKIDPFAEQNAERVAKEKKRAKQRKKAAIMFSIVVGLVIVSAAIAIVLVSPGPVNEETVIDETISSYNTIQNESQQNFDSTNRSASEVISYYKNLINQVSSNEEKATLCISEISSLAQNGFIDDAIQAALNFEESSYRSGSNQAQLSIYYGVMINIYSSIKDTERVDYYVNLLQQTEFKPDMEVIG